MLRASTYFTLAVTLVAAQAFNLDFLPRRPKALILENMITKNALDKESPDFCRDEYNEPFPKALTGLLTETTLHDHSRILKDLQMNVEDQIMKQFEKIPAASRPRTTVSRKNLRRKNNKATWYSRIS